MNLRSFLVVASFLIVRISTFCQVDNVGSGRALKLNGSTDYIVLGNVYDDLALPVSIEAWVKIVPNVDYAFPIFYSQDNLPLYNGIGFQVRPNSFAVGYGDGRGENSPAYRRDKGASVSNISGRWVHLVGIIRGATDMDLFLNGNNVGGSYSGSSPFPISSNSPGDVAKIGYWLSNGIESFFQGEIDELRIWNKALTQAEVRSNMCRKLSGMEPNLIGYWTFDETMGNTVLDKSPNGFHGTIVGNPQRVFSGAPLGDASSTLYTSNWANESISLAGGGSILTAFSVSGNPWGIHIYRVDSYPSQSTGLSSPLVQLPYFGVFLASSNAGGSFQTMFNVPLSCPLFSRSDNSESAWNPGGSSFSYQVEIVRQITGSDITVNLGPDEIFCDVNNKVLNPVLDQTGRTFLWSNGATTSTIKVGESGLYWVEVKQSCQINRDSIQLTFLRTPEIIDLGKDIIVCNALDVTLEVSHEVGDEVQWNTGSKESSIQVTESGTYWAVVKNLCGLSRDTIQLKSLELDIEKIPNAITPNGDGKNDFFIVEEPLQGSFLSIYNRWGKLVFNSPNYKNNWNGDGLASGVYFWKADGACVGDAKGTISIVR